jgi:hypothetical protein
MQTLATMDKNNIIEGMDISGNHDLNFFDECVYGKYHHTSIFFSKGFCTKEIFGPVHTNVCGPMTTTTHGGAKYLTFIDDFLKKSFFNTMKTKFGVLNNLKVFKALVKNQIKKKHQGNQM